MTAITAWDARSVAAWCRARSTSAVVGTSAPAAKIGELGAPDTAAAATLRRRAGPAPAVASRVALMAVAFPLALASYVFAAGSRAARGRERATRAETPQPPKPGVRNRPVSRSGPADPDIVHAGGAARQSAVWRARGHRGARDCLATVGRGRREQRHSGRRARGHHRGARHRLLRLERHRHHERARRRGRDLRHAARRGWRSDAGDGHLAQHRSGSRRPPRVEGEGRATRVGAWIVGRRQGGAGDRRDRIAHGAAEHGHARDRQQPPPHGPGDAGADRCRDQPRQQWWPLLDHTAAWSQWRR